MGFDSLLKFRKKAEGKKLLFSISYRWTLYNRHIASQKIFGGQWQIMEGQNIFVYSDENEGIKCLYRYYSHNLCL